MLPHTHTFHGFKGHCSFLVAAIMSKFSQLGLPLVTMLVANPEAVSMIRVVSERNCWYLASFLYS